MPMQTDKLDAAGAGPEPTPRMADARPIDRDRGAMAWLRRLIALTVRLFVTDYRLNWIYAPARVLPILLPAGLSFAAILEQERLLIARSPYPEISRALSYQLSEADGYVLIQNGDPVSVVHFADAKTYGHQSTWPLQPGGRALVDVVTAEHARGLGFAPMLIAAASQDVLRLASETFAFIWWTHRKSRIAFRKAGWRPIGFSIEIDRRDRRPLALRVRWPFGRPG
jgi:ribosomal protein S18 acetylase RimI-like enzyme